MTEYQLAAMSRAGETGETIFRAPSVGCSGNDASRYEIAALIKERDGWQDHAKWLQRNLHLTQCDNTLLRAAAKKDIWVWQGDGTDYLESMSDRMVVVIFAKDLRTAIAATAATGEAS